MTDKNLFSFGNYLNYNYKPLLDSFFNSNIITKFSIISFKFIELVIIFIVLFGCLFPRNLLIWHIVLCLFIFMLIEIDYNPISNYIYNTINSNKNNPKYSEFRMKNSSNTIPILKNTCKKILFGSMFLSIIGYIYPQYSLNQIIKSFANKSENINIDDLNANDQNIITEFKTATNYDSNLNDISIINDDIDILGIDKNIIVDSLLLNNNNDLIKTAKAINIK